MWFYMVLYYIMWFYHLPTGEGVAVFELPDAENSRTFSCATWTTDY